ncbi:hypothetical protein BDZ94DRAFT_1203376 [Collybia nuda]|uniref:Uncharacterized protein n=1 Tax=Collybia nuda TaxID=64659 RepID=A0A9P6C9D9_9AGAR|nr:hypothetical protein BDZ94DRAFT_1203376 [Collybia nuda]
MSDSEPMLKPTPARFIHPMTAPSPPSTAALVSSYDDQESTLDITDVQSRSSFKARTPPSRFGYPPRMRSSNLHHHSPGPGGHTPVAATALFAHNAAPLSLPNLDKYLASMPSPDFSDIVLDDNGMFSPMGELSKLNISLDDLETNVRRPSVWSNRTTILGSAANLIIGFMGSSAFASFYSLQGLFNTIQIFALILSTIVPIGGKDLEDKWRKLFLGTIPNVLALNFASTLSQSLIFLLIFMGIAAALLYCFYRFTLHCNRFNDSEGLQQKTFSGKQWGVVIVTFLLTVIYLPLSTMAVHVLVWSQDLWVVPNPYLTSSVLPVLGTPGEYRSPTDFCWTTTMKRNQINYAPVIIILSSVVFIFLTLWFPMALRRVIRQSVPKVDRFSALGRARGEVDMDGEYHRLLSRDQNPFAFLYNGFRRGWGTYESSYLFAKLSTLVIIAVIDPDNCLFRSFSRSRMILVRQIFLLISTIGFFLAQCIFAPFLDPVNNASEWTSRLNYITTAIVALVVVFHIPGEDIVKTYVLYSIYITTYGLSFYFSIINQGFMQRAVKRFSRRIDFSIDIFSPSLDIKTTSIHTKRRIWQESITVLLLTTPKCAIPKEQAMKFAQARDSEFPPYLLGFCGTPGERHAENLKILREVGTQAYDKAATLLSGPDYMRYKNIKDKIQRSFIGPDSYWKNPNSLLNPKCRNFFGNGWWIPFPPALVLRYDDGPLVVLKEAAELETYIIQNSSDDIQRRRLVRISLRALEGQVVTWPYDHISQIGYRSIWCCGGKHYGAISSISYHSCVLRIKRQGDLAWNGYQLGSGFGIQLVYPNNIVLPGDVIGINDDYDLTAPLAQFLKLNQHLLHERLRQFEGMISTYRRHQRRESHWKTQVLPYEFLSFIYNQPQDPTALTGSFIRSGCDLGVQQSFMNDSSPFVAAYQRFLAVTSSEAATWWYIFWDDLWRRNNDAITELRIHAADFDPHYPTSIAYTPLPRAALEGFLAQRGLFSKGPNSHAFFTPGFLNKIYLRLNDTVFRASSHAILFHLGDDDTEFEMNDVDLETRAPGSTSGTGGGTDHDDSWIRTRPTYRWEGLLNDRPIKGKKGRRKWLTKLGAWLGLTPLWETGIRPGGVSLDVYLENGQYVILDPQENSTAQGLG